MPYGGRVFLGDARPLLRLQYVQVMTPPVAVAAEPALIDYATIDAELRGLPAVLPPGWMWCHDYRTATHYHRGMLFCSPGPFRDKWRGYLAIRQREGEDFKRRLVTAAKDFPPDISRQRDIFYRLLTSRRAVVLRQAVDAAFVQLGLGSCGPENLDSRGWVAVRPGSPAEERYRREGLAGELLDWARCANREADAKRKALREVDPALRAEARRAFRSWEGMSDLERQLGVLLLINPRTDTEGNARGWRMRSVEQLVAHLEVESVDKLRTLISPDPS